VSIIVVSIFSPNRPVYATTSILITDKINEASTLPQDRFGYQEFRTFTNLFTYAGGDACLSKNSGWCDPIQVDDGIKVWVNGTPVGDFQSKTQPVTIIIPSNLLMSGQNTIRVTLYDMQGPFRGTSPIYLVMDGSSWYNGCQNQVLGAQVKSGEITIPDPDGSGEGVWRYEYNIEGCNNFVVAKNSGPGKSFGVDIEGTANNTKYTLSFDYKGEVTSSSMSIGFTKGGPQLYWIPGDGLVYLYEIGTQYENKYGSQAIGMVGTQTNQVGYRAKNRQNPPAQRVVIDPAFNPNFLNGLRPAFAVIGTIAYVIANVILNPDLAFTKVMLMPTLQIWWNDHKWTSITNTVTKVVSRVALNANSSSVAPDVQTAVNQRLGSLASFTTLGAITSRDSVSGYTIFDFTSGGFSPNNPVYVTFGVPGSPNDFYVLLLKADAAGNIRGTINMPTKNEVTYGKHLLLAMDYAKMESSINSVFADPVNGTLNVYGAAKLIDVVQDVTPPATTAFATGPLDVNRVFKDTVTLSFSSTDDVSGVDHTEYSLNGGTSWISIPPTGTFTLSGNGITSFLYRSVDKYGNVELAKDSGPIAIAKYVVFANDPTTSLSIQTNTSIAITGTMHTNGNASIVLNTSVQQNGTLEAALGGSQVLYNTATNVTVVPGAVVPMLSYPMASYQKMATTVYSSNVTFNNTAQNLSGVYYVNGDVTIRSATFTGDVTIAATGNIYDQSTSTSIVSNDPNNGITLYAGRDIYVQGTSTKAVGLFYAPSGTIWVNAATSLTLNGSMVAKAVVIKNSSRIAIKYAAGFPAKTYQLPITAAQEAKATGVLYTK